MSFFVDLFKKNESSYLLVDERVRIGVRFGRILHAYRANDEILLHETAEHRFGYEFRPERVHGGREELESGQGQLRRDLVRRLVRVLHRKVTQILQCLALLPFPFASVVH